MSPVFADTLYWYGLANPRDQWHTVAFRVEAQLIGRQIVTTDEVLMEFLTAISGGGEYLRRQVALTLYPSRSTPLKLAAPAPLQLP
jgi:predicted nucleic acid-binding protein